jgi:PDDEXK-like uncharacterized protein DUF3799
MTEITEPGVYDIPADVYHADPVEGGSLSSSGARALLATCPARFRWEQQYPPAPTDAMEIGTAAHKMVLGVGPEIVTVEANDWRTKAAQQQRHEARARDAVALLEDDVARVEEMAAALRRHRLACALLNPDRGRPEQAIFWIDEETGVWRRALVDWLPNVGTGRPVVVDYKTTVSADREAIRKSVDTYGYHQQAAWYLDGVHALGLADDAGFLFIFQEKEPPYLITVAQLDQTAMEVGRDLNRRALEMYRDCRDADIWPGHSDDMEIQEISLPPWTVNRHWETAS